MVTLKFVVPVSQPPESLCHRHVPPAASNVSALDYKSTMLFVTMRSILPCISETVMDVDHLLVLSLMKTGD